MTSAASREDPVAKAKASFSAVVQGAGLSEKQWREDNQAIGSKPHQYIALKSLRPFDLYDPKEKFPYDAMPEEGTTSSGVRVLFFTVFQLLNGQTE